LCPHGHIGVLEIPIQFVGSEHMKQIPMKQIPAKLCLCLIFAGQIVSGAALAGPDVQGNTISWPDDGWYQVQTSSSYEEVCGGGRSCVVAPGNYIVINHSTGERFSDIVVDGNGISVAGNTISWPDDGWYQVQDEATHSEICSGGRSCEVEPGTYVVINHSTGERFENISVDQDDEPAAHVVVIGNVISWPDDGWYQVQDEATYSEICGGGRSCEVEPGRYVVINHSTGVRTDGIVVSGDNGSSLSVNDAPVFLEIAHAKYMIDIATYVFHIANSTNTGFVELDSPVVFDTPEASNVEFNFILSCPKGGSLYFRANLVSATVRSLEFLYDECTLQGGTLLGGYSSFYSQSRSPPAVLTYELEAINHNSMTSISGGVIELSGGQSTRLKIDNYIVEASGQSYSVENLEISIGSQNGNNGGDTVGVTFTVTEFNGRQSNYVGRTDPAFEISPDKTTAAGRLVVSDGDSSLIVDSESSSIDEYTVVVQNGDAIVSDIQPWSMIVLVDNDIYDLDI